MPLNIASATLTQSLPANALVRTFTVNVRADAAGVKQLKEVGQVRLQSSQQAGNTGGTSVVIDFGSPLTISQAAAPAGVTIRAIYRWRGDSFDVTNPVFSNANGTATATFAEVSVSRLQLELNPAVTQAQAEAVTVLLPSLPADLEVRVNDGPVVWRYPGPRGAPGTDGWTAVTVGAATYTQSAVDLTGVVSPMLGNPESSAPVTVTVELRARVPGRLEVVAGTADYDLLQKVPALPEPNLVFEEEGDQNLSLNIPGGTATVLKEVWLTVSGAPPKERAVPAVGPSRVTAVALLLDPGRSATVRFPEDQLGELTALRLPLTAQDGTAEVRAQLLSPLGTLPNDEPGPPLEGTSATQPVQLEPPLATPRGVTNGVVSDPDTWVLLPFDKPVTIKGPVWVQLQVTRGTVRWALGAYAAADGTPYPVRRGSPTGPWLPLPAAVTAMTGLGGRLHAIGHALKASPLAPLQLQVQADTPVYDGELTDVTPTAKGVTLKLPVDPAAGVPSQRSWLRVISRCATTVTVASLIRVVAKP